MFVWVKGPDTINACSFFDFDGRRNRNNSRATRTMINANPPSTAPTMEPTFRDDDDARFTWFGVAPVEFDDGEVLEEESECLEEAGLAEVGSEEVEFEAVEFEEAEFEEGEFEAVESEAVEDVPDALELEGIVIEVEGDTDTVVSELEDGVEAPWVGDVVVAAEIDGSDVTVLNGKKLISQKKRDASRKERTYKEHNQSQPTH